MTSSNGQQWSSEVDLGKNTDLDCVSFGKGVFIAGGGVISAQPGGQFWSSPDGVSWTPIQTQNNIYSLKGITYGNSLFVAVDGSGAIMTSPDGNVWTVQKPSQGGSLTSMYVLSGVCYGNNTFVAVGGSGTVNTASFNNGVILTSNDGVNWNTQPSGIQNLLTGAVYGNQTFVVVGCGGVILTSKDGQTWTSQSSGTQDAFTQVVYGNGTFVVVGNNGVIVQSGAASQNSGQ
jgi:hypothetical protein